MGSERVPRIDRALLTSVWPWAAAAISGGLLVFCYAPFSWGSLAFLALAPLTAAIWFSQEWSRREPLRLFLLGYLTGFVFFLGSLSWVHTVTVPGLLLLVAYLALYPGLWAIFTGLVARPLPRAGSEEPVWFGSWSNLRAAALAAAAWVALEWVRGWMFSGFGWNSLGVALVDNLPLIQIADITGVAGVSFLLVMVSAVAAITVLRLRMEIARGKMRGHYDFSIVVVLVAAAFSYGARKLTAPPTGGEDLTFAAVQANIPINEKRDPARDAEILAIHDQMSATALAMHPDLLIWPEAATPHPLFLDQRSWQAVSKIAKGHGGDFLLGTVHYDDFGDFNSAALLTGHGSQVQLYHKMHLVAFGEYVPFRESFPLFAWIVGDLVPEDFDAGRTAEVMDLAVRPIRVGPLICFEDTLPYIARKFATGGAQVFVNLTNDAWFGRSAGPEQHRANAVFRTIETRLPMIRAANSGVTCVIDTFGRETHRLEETSGNTFFDGILFGKVSVPQTPSPTFYTLNGDLFAKVCAAFAAAACVVRNRRRM